MDIFFKTITKNSVAKITSLDKVNKIVINEKLLGFIKSLFAYNKLLINYSGEIAIILTISIVPYLRNYFHSKLQNLLIAKKKNNISLKDQYKRNLSILKWIH